ncbi:solute carrier family 25 member 45-like isoform X2 [Photinus pyralis]|uniref:solute carrier family 25 member 45-like isoform X2 n=1 Tax=Photinus pyralis TaxID=7054 RepID=UPI00126730BF|nr:solute carrier family 25 member 45-like isoform X2 [Photinus pyralis]
MIDWINFIAGWLGGIAGLIIGHPMDTLKTRQQSTGHSLSTTIKEIYQHEGIRGCYKGFFVQYFTVGPANAVFFFAYGESLKVVQKNGSGRVDFNDTKWRMNVALAGLLAGTVQVIVTSPIEFVKTLLQTGNSRSLKNGGPQYKTAIQAIRGIYRRGGLLGFYRGFIPTFWRDGASSSIYLVVYESLRPRNREHALTELITAGGMAGAFGLLVPISAL